jgi:hypothetical protein
MSPRVAYTVGDFLIFHILHHNQSDTELCTVTETVIRIYRWTAASLEIRLNHFFQSQCD